MFQNAAAKTAIALVTAAIVFGLASTATAATEQGSASITILDSLQVTEATAMNFGHVHRPSSGQNTLTLDHEGDQVTLSGSGDAKYVDGTAETGIYNIQGSADEAIQISVSADDFDDDGLTLRDVFVDGYDDTARGYLNESGEYNANVGGTVDIDADASLGTHTTDVFVTVEYE